MMKSSRFWPGMRKSENLALEQRETREARNVILCGERFPLEEEQDGFYNKGRSYKKSFEKIKRRGWIK